MNTLLRRISKVEQQRGGRVCRVCKGKGLCMVEFVDEHGRATQGALASERPGCPGCGQKKVITVTYVSVGTPATD